MSTLTSVDVAHQPRKWKVATVSLAGCFGCHTSFLDIDERLLELIEHVEFDRSPLTDIKEVGLCDIGLIEGGVCNSENVLVLRAFRARCKTLVAMGACAINGGLPAERNRFELADVLNEVYRDRPGLSEGSAIPNCRFCCGKCDRSMPSCMSITFYPVVRLRQMPSGVF
jgi:NAD-reducing hydrogenase small subunit